MKFVSDGKKLVEQRSEAIGYVLVGLAVGLGLWACIIFRTRLSQDIAAGAARFVFGWIW